MKQVACIVFEIEDGERLEDFVEKIRKVLNVKSINLVRKFDWKDKLKAVLSKLGVTANCRGYRKLFYMVHASHKIPHATMNQLYKYAAKECKEDASAVKNQVEYIVRKIERCNSYKQICEALEITLDSNMKITPARFVRTLAEVVY